MKRTICISFLTILFFAYKNKAIKQQPVYKTVQNNSQGKSNVLIDLIAASAKLSKSDA